MVASMLHSLKNCFLDTTISTTAGQFGKLLLMDIDKTLESLYHHLRSVYGGHCEPDFDFMVKICDRAGIPMWQQNNISAMAEDPEVYNRNGLSTVIEAAKQLDWRPHVVR